jgi:hypothetical protein
MALLILILLVILALTGSLLFVLKVALGVALGLFLGVFLMVAVVGGMLAWRIRRAMYGPRSRGRVRGSSRVDVLDPRDRYR